MEYMIGGILGLAVGGFATVVGFDRERAFYPTVLIVIAAYYVLFAVMGAPARILGIETAIAGVFLLIAVLGYKTNFWLIVAGLIGHGSMDFVHHLFVQNAGVPQWWPGFCGAIDVILGGWLAVRLMRDPTVSPTRPAG
jgi:hypothetical protein